MSARQYHHGDLKNALVEAGMELLSEQGLEALSLREVARRAGVSHSAPYSHFADKQGLIAAISTEGFRRLYERVREAAETDPEGTPSALLEAAWAYTEFALEQPACFKIMFSGILEREDQYPELVDISQRNFQLLVRLVERMQGTGVLPPGHAEMQAVSLWSLVHGFTALLIERQISHKILDRWSRKDLLSRTLSYITLASRNEK